MSLRARADVSSLICAYFYYRAYALLVVNLPLLLRNDDLDDEVLSDAFILRFVFQA